MLCQVSSNHNEEFTKSIKIGDLSMGTNNISIDNLDQAEFPKKPDSTPVRRFATPWLRSDLGFFYVDVAIVGPVSKEPKGCFPLSRSEANSILKAVTDIIELLEEKSW